MCKELVSIPWTSKPWVLSECHCLGLFRFKYPVSVQFGCCVVRTQLQHSILTEEFWVARCVSSFVDISSLLRLAGRNPRNPTLTYCIPWGGLERTLKEGNIWCLPVSFVMRAMVISKKMKYISIAFKLHTLENTPLCAGTVGQFHFFSCGLSSNWAHDTTEPFAFRAANAPLVWHKSTTPADTSSHTSKESPPLFSSPQVMTTLVLKP